MIKFFVLSIWLAGIFIVYKRRFSKLENNTKFEKVWFSVCWPLCIPLYIVWYLHNK